MQKSGLDKWPLIGQHPTLLDVQKRACRVANSELPVNISGETGTGKELLARYIHGISHRNRGPFVTVDCGLLTSEMARSELFGYVRGAFTGASETRLGLVESARGGTLFLDEIGELPSNLQLQLLRLVQEQEFRRVGEASMRRSNVRLITATHCNLRKMVRKKSFREDLYYRLNVVPIQLPALRKRLSDLPLLIAHFCQEMKEYNRVFSSEVIQRMSHYAWPGNVRELQHEVARLMVMGEGKIIRVSDLRSRIRGSKPEVDVFDLPFKEARQLANSQFMREYLDRALKKTQGNVSEAARQCGIGRQYFQLRMSEHGLRSAYYKKK
ncbi:MAG: sigma-54 dependent transcriptional regulator [Gemmatimonadetes bacterium]|nr:sigma-54 dependent transcriptional regulator [Gemmatimonadota bacterium]